MSQGLGSRRDTRKSLVKPRKITLVADSHGRFLASHLNSYLPAGYKVTSSFFPGAPLATIVRLGHHMLSNLVRGDTAIIMGGTNDVENTLDQQREFENALGYISELAKRVQVILVYVPQRLDRVDLNVKVHKINRTLGLLQNVYKLEPPNDLNLFREDHVHLTYEGKIALVKQMVFAIKQTKYTSNMVTQEILENQQLPVRLDHEVKLLESVNKYIDAVKSQVIPYNVSSRLYTDVTLGGLQATALLDSGASHVFVNSEFFFPMQQKGIVIRPLSTVAEMANGSKGEITGVACIPINIGPKTWVGDCFLIKHLPYDLIIGINVMRELRAVVNFATNHVSFQDGSGREDIPVFELAAMDVSVDAEESAQRDPENFLLENNPFSILDTLSDEVANPEQMQQCRELLLHWIRKFSDSPGCTNVTRHKIYLEDPYAPPIKISYRLYSPITESIIKEEVQKLIDKGIVEESDSPYSFPVLIVPKKNGKKRVCVDFRALNAVTRKNSYPIPRVDQLLDRLKDSYWCSSLDLVSGFYQIELEEESKPLTAFSVNDNHYQFKRLPMGLSGAPGSFQSCMNKILRPVLNKSAFVYLDDVLIASPTFEKHLEDLSEVLGLLRTAGLQINWEKSFFLRPYIEFLGYTVGQGMKLPSQSKVEAVSSFPPPKSLKQLRSFLGLTGWYRKFIPNYATIAAPLTELLHKNVDFIWSEAQKQAFDALKETLTSGPLLYCPDFSKPFVVETDASNVGAAGILLQIINGEERVVAYTSKTLSKAERNYSTTEKELLAVLHSLETFRGYIENTKIKVVTDHASLSWLSNFKAPSGRLTRWLARLAMFDIELVHRKGSLMKAADALSRAPYNLAVINLPKVPADFGRAKDPWYASLYNRVKKYPASYPAFYLQGDYLFKKVRDKKLKTEEFKLYVPYDYRYQLIQQNHNSPMAGHPGINKTIERIARQYYWPSLVNDVRSYVRECKDCLTCKPSNQKPIGEMRVKPTNVSPGAIWCGDAVGPLVRSKRGNKYIITFVDTCTKFLVAVPVKAATAKAAARVLVENVILEFGSPSIIVVDNGSIFISEAFKKTCEEFNIQVNYIPKYTPWNNEVERYHRTLKQTLTIFCNQEQDRWDEHLKYAVFAMRTNKNDTTGYSPALLQYGRELKSCYELFDPTHHGLTGSFNPTIYVNSLKENLAKIYKNVDTAVQQAKGRQMRQYNLRTRPVVFKPGELVYRTNFVQSSAINNITKKLCPKWIGPYVIEKQLAHDQYELVDSKGKSQGRWSAAHLKSAINPLD